MPIVSKSDQFKVDSYTVNVSQKTSGPERNITLKGTTATTGVKTTATILFRAPDPSQKVMGAVETSGGNLVAFANNDLFDGLYAVLLTESPVTATYKYDADTSQPKQTAWNLTSVGLQTTDEAPGDFEK